MDSTACGQDDKMSAGLQSSFFYLIPFFYIMHRTVTLEYEPWSVANYHKDLRANVKEFCFCIA
jgi:hypothetical protein